MTFGLLGGVTPKSTSSSGGGSTIITSEDVMSEIKEIKYTIWLDEYKSFGEESHVFNNKDNWAELMQSNAALNDSTLSAMAFNFLIENDIDPLIAMGNVYGTGIDFKQYGSFEDIVINDNYVRKIINHPVLSKMVYGYQPYADILYGSNSGVWNIVDIEMIQSMEENQAFVNYVSSLQSQTSQVTVTNGYYFLDSVDTTGRNYHVENEYYQRYAGNSGASYTDITDTVINIRSAQTGSTNPGDYASKTHSIKKIAKVVTLVNGTANNAITEYDDYGNWKDRPLAPTTLKSTAHYKILRN